MKLFPNTVKGFVIHIVIIALLGMGFTLFFFYIYLPTHTNHGETVTVPDLEGIHMDKIEEFLVKRSLRYEINDSAYSDKYPPLTILKQYPKAGSQVKENRKIFISVNRTNPPTVPLPELVDRSLRNAEAVLKSNELKKGKTTYRPNRFLNLVLEVRMDGEILNIGDRIPKGSVIDLIVGDGCANCRFDVPDLVGMTFEDAKIIISGSDLRVGLIEVEGDTSDIAIEEIMILRQSPGTGRKVKAFDEIDLWIGPPVDSLDLDLKQASLDN